MLRLSLYLWCAWVIAGCGGRPDSADASSVSEDELRATNDLTAEEQKLVLRLVDNRCGDTWCDGDYDWRFKKITCSFASKQACTMTTMAIDTIDTHKYYWRSCKMTGIRSFDEMVVTFPNGYQDITEAFGTKLDDCMAKLERSLPPA
jgi:hypothetical protein